MNVFKKLVKSRFLEYIIFVKFWRCFERYFHIKLCLTEKFKLLLLTFQDCSSNYLFFSPIYQELIYKDNFFLLDERDRHLVQMVILSFLLRTSIKRALERKWFQLNTKWSTLSDVEGWDRSVVFRLTSFCRITDLISGDVALLFALLMTYGRLHSKETHVTL